MAAIFIELIPILARENQVSILPASIEFSAATYGDGDTAVVFVRDSDLNAPSSCEASWSDIPSPMEAFEWWNLATGSPYEDLYPLNQDCEFDTETPSQTPLRLSSPPWQIKIDGAQVHAGNIDQMLGRFMLVNVVNASSTVHALFHFDEPHSYPASSTVARIYSDSDLAGEALLLTEVTSESNLSPSPSSEVFRGAITIPSDPASQALNDGAVWVRFGDSLHAEYLGLAGGESPLSSAVASLDLPVPTPTPTPVPAASTVSIAILGAALIILTLWQLTRAPRPKRRQ